MRFTNQSFIPGSVGELGGLRKSRLRYALAFCCFALIAAVLPLHADWHAVFPQFTSGGGWSSDLFITNQGTSAVNNLSLSFYGDTGSPLTVETNLGTGSTFSFNLIAGGTQIVRVSATGSLKVGYAVLRMPGYPSIRGSEVFRNAQNEIVVTEMGVAQQYPFIHFSFPAEVDSSHGINTGIAIASPTIDSGTASGQKVVVNLIKSDGTLQAVSVISMGVGEHLAQFLNESKLFPGLDNFSGTVSVSASTPIGVVALRQDQGVYGTVAINEGPVLSPFMVTTNSISEIESNNSPSQAQLLSGSSLVSGSIGNSGDVDYFKFSGKQGDIVTVVLDSMSLQSDLDSVLRLEKEDGTILSQNDQNGLMWQNDSFLQVVLPADGMYYLRLWDYWNGGGSTFTYHLNVRISGSGGAPVLPQITSINPNTALRGSVVSLTIQGTNLSGTSSIGFNPSDGISISNLQSSATQVTALLTISASATAGSRQVTVTTPGGSSNALGFTITAPASGPQITSLSPSTGARGATVNLTIFGSNLSGVSSINISPATDITITNLQSSASQVTASVFIAASAATGTRGVTVTTSAGTSNSLGFTITSGSSGSTPTVSNLSVGAPSGGGPTVTLSGSFDFTDPGGDITYSGSTSGSAKIVFTITMGLGTCSITGTGPFLNRPGETSGHINFSFSYNPGSLSIGTFYVSFRLVDAAGNSSNSLSFSPGLWMCKRLERGPDPTLPKDFRLPSESIVSSPRREVLA